MVCANVLQWAPSRVTRRGALAATAAAAAAAAFPPSSRYLPPPSVSLHTHARPLLLLGPRSSWSRGPLGTPHPHYGAPWSRGRQPSPTQNTPSLFRLFLNSATDDSSSYSPSFVRPLPSSLGCSSTLSRYHFLSPLSFACSPQRSCGYQYSVSKLLESFTSFHDFHIFLILHIS